MYTHTHTGCIWRVLAAYGGCKPSYLIQWKNADHRTNWTNWTCQEAIEPINSLLSEFAPDDLPAPTTSPCLEFFFAWERDADGSGGSKVWMPTSWWVTLRSFESHFKPMSLSGPEALSEHRRASEKKWLNRIFSVNLLLHQIAWIENDWDRFSSILWESEKDRACDSVTWSPRPGQELLRTGSVISQFHNRQTVAAYNFWVKELDPQRTCPPSFLKCGLRSEV